MGLHDGAEVEIGMEGGEKRGTNNRERLLRGETEDNNVTRQPKSCYATADLLTHISSKGAGETGAKGPAAHNTQAARAKRQKQHPAQPLTTPPLSRAATEDGDENFSAFLGGFFHTRKEKGETGARQLCVGEAGIFLPPLGHGEWSANRSTETDPQGAPKVDGLTYILRKTLRAAA
ncbi:Fructose-bisphosphate aldolase 2 [Dissostichus eleginoides]|uniref:Fructose-bisphosphate aldolase 2 n=1 Tax=Dissostichus eleginoides TaxID=100907 RepID=A0AAD9F2Q2_DISEL|nr:Fructose-bisphosphate aldolase 2 [Dissostichus eleginoides]